MIIKNYSYCKVYNIAKCYYCIDNIINIISNVNIYLKLIC